MPLLRVGTLQIKLEENKRDKNFSHIEKYMDSHYTQSEIPTVIVLPELFDVGYDLKNADKSADVEAKEALIFLRHLAEKYDCYFVGGSVLAKTESGIKNRALAVSPQKEYIAYYDKAHLVPMINEGKYLSSGDKRVTFEIEGVKSSMAICYDIRFCEWICLGAIDGAKILFVSAEWPLSRLDHWITLLKARAIENMMFVVACSRCGASKDAEYSGHSLIISPNGDIISDSGSNESLDFKVIDSNDSDKQREFLHVLNLRRKDIYL
ncbi:MAG: nitrilase-related carbon-nitrogen hydrolase [Synergistaceae bacterium]